METRYNFDSTGATVTVIVLAPGFLMMTLGFIGTSPLPRLLLALAVGMSVLVLLWFGFARGTYVLIDSKKDIYRTSGFFFSKMVPLSSIQSLNARGTFMGLMTNIDLKYRDQNGEIKTIGTMNVQSFKKGDFKKFLSTIRSVNPNVEISKDIFTK